MGRGERDAADGAAVEKMREALNEMEIAGRIVIGEGERDEAPMLFIGEEVGRGGDEVDIAVDPVEGTNLVANGLPNSIAVMAISERGGLLHAPDSYMKKLAVGPKAAPYVHIDAPVAENLEAVANALERPINDVMRRDSRSSAARGPDRRSPDGRRAHQTDLRRRRRRVHRDGDRRRPASTSRWAPAARRKACSPRRRIKCLGGNFMGRLKPRNEEEAERAEGNGFRRSGPRLTIDDLVKSDNVVFCATGITDGDLVRGVRFYGNQARTHSILVHSRAARCASSRAIHRLGARPHRDDTAPYGNDRRRVRSRRRRRGFRRVCGRAYGARFRRDVALVDHGPLGGLCILRGCMPSKALIASSDRAAGRARRGRTRHYAGEPASTSTCRSWPPQARARRRISPTTASTGSTSFRSIPGPRAFCRRPSWRSATTWCSSRKRFIIATGSTVAPAVLPGLAETGYIDSDGVLEFERAPESAIVLGGGYIACELGQFFARVGAKTTMLIRSGHLLTETDDDVGDALTGYLRDEGIDVETRTTLIARASGATRRRPCDTCTTGRNARSWPRRSSTRSGACRTSRGSGSSARA